MRDIGIDVRFSSIAVRNVLLIDAVATRVARAVVVASQDVVGLLAHAVPVVGRAGVELGLRGAETAGDDAIAITSCQRCEVRSAYMLLAVSVFLLVDLATAARGARRAGRAGSSGGSGSLRGCEAGDGEEEGLRGVHGRFESGGCRLEMGM